MGRRRYKITEPQQPDFVTFTVLHWILVFTRPDTINILLDSLCFLSKHGLKVSIFASQGISALVAVGDALNKQR
ncbi:MAG: hypothetical protein K0A92_09820 [Methyloprofundus sp.]|nr:hypothetical protein [Methyloprofundus sp.]